MTKTYHYKKGTMPMGPYPLDKMRALARQGQVGRSHQISADGCETWSSGASYPEIFAAGEEASPSDRGGSTAGRGGSGSGQPAGPPAEPAWHFKVSGGDAQGPVTESQVKTMIELGTLGPRDKVWTEAMGATWAAVADVPRLSGFLPRKQEPQIDVESRRKSRSKLRHRTGRGGRDQPDSEGKRGFNGAGLSGFICSMVAIVLLAIPCLVWVIVAESFFWIFNIVIPFTILAIVGLVLSVIGLRRTPRGMATTGTVLGVIALMLGVMALVGWAMLPYRLAMQRRTEIDAFATDIKLEEKNLAEQVARYRKVGREESESEEEFAVRAAVNRRLVGVQLDTLVKAYDGHVSATAKTSEFREAFLGLAKLRKTIDEVGQAARAVESLEVIDVLDISNADARAIKVLMDTLKLFERGEITLKQAEAKMTGR
jgi:hypothetical protein